VLAFLLAPRWLALHALTIAAVAGMLVLGRWQAASVAEDAVVAAPRAPADVTTLVPPGTALTTAAVGRVVALEGSPVGSPLLVPDRPGPDGAGTGTLVVAALTLPDGATVPVVRGWAPASTAVAPWPTGATVAVEGIVTPFEQDADATGDPLAVLPDGQVAALTGPALFRTLPVDPATLVQALVVATEETVVGGTAASPDAALVPVPPDATPDSDGVSPWRHWSYAAQWWLFAGAAVVFWASMLRSGWRDHRAAQSAVDRDDVAASR
jgi:cytochrome oxidase assembly protein ShyY1